MQPWRGEVSSLIGAILACADEGRLNDDREIVTFMISQAFAYYDALAVQEQKARLPEHKRAHGRELTWADNARACQGISALAKFWPM